MENSNKGICAKDLKLERTQLPWKEDWRSGGVAKIKDPWNLDLFPSQSDYEKPLVFSAIGSTAREFRLTFQALYKVIPKGLQVCISTFVSLQSFSVRCINNSSWEII